MLFDIILQSWIIQFWSLKQLIGKRHRVPAEFRSLLESFEYVWCSNAETLNPMLRRSVRQIISGPMRLTINHFWKTSLCFLITLSVWNFASHCHRWNKTSNASMLLVYTGDVPAYCYWPFNMNLVTRWLCVFPMVISSGFHMAHIHIIWPISIWSMGRHTQM